MVDPVTGEVIGAPGDDRRGAPARPRRRGAAGRHPARAGAGHDDPAARHPGRHPGARPRRRRAALDPRRARDARRRRRPPAGSSCSSSSPGGWPGSKVGPATAVARRGLAAGARGARRPTCGPGPLVVGGRSAGRPGRLPHRRGRGRARRRWRWRSRCTRPGKPEKLAGRRARDAVGARHPGAVVQGRSDPFGTPAEVEAVLPPGATLDVVDRRRTRSAGRRRAVAAAGASPRLAAAEPPGGSTPAGNVGVGRGVDRPVRARAQARSRPRVRPRHHSPRPGRG